MKKQLLTLLILLLAATTQAQTSQTLKKLFDDIAAYNNAYDINTGLWEGKHPKSIEVPGWKKIQIKHTRYQDYLTRLEAIENKQLNRQDQISKAVMLLQLKDYISSVQYKSLLMPFNAEGGFFNEATFFLPLLPFASQTDYQNYLQWLPAYTKWIEANQQLMEHGIREKIVAPKVIVRNMIKLLQPWTNKDYKKNPFYAPLLKMPVGIPAKKQAQLRAKGAQIVQKNILPAYRRLLNFVQNQYMKASPEKIGVSNLPNGRAYYQNRVKHFTTLNMSPDEVFNIGQQEVKRIRAKMEKIIKDLKFKGNWADFLQFMRTDPQFFPRTGQELLNYAAWLSKKAEGQLPRLFAKLYNLPFTVVPVPAAVAPTYTTGRYSGGSRNLNTAGEYWVNTYNLKSRTLYTIPALTLHEAVPGHHLQITMAAENSIEGNPDFRNTYYISAFGEGWGLYAEFLGEEMGMYTTPYNLFGRYTYEIWRACRLVVDVGMHYKGWHRNKAVKFMANNTALSLHEVNTEIDRYIAWPGQALSYKIGEITIKRLRRKAEKELGKKFDIQQFHAVVLRNGSIPLPVLIEEVEKYIKESK